MGEGQGGTLFICGQAVPLLVLGDPAYPLLPWLLKAFIDHGSLTAEQKLFNYSLSKARVIVEHEAKRSMAVSPEEGRALLNCCLLCSP